MESLPVGWSEDADTGIKSYNPLEAARKLVEGQGKVNKDRIQRREAVVDDVSGLATRLEAVEDRVATLETKFKALYEVVETLQERIGD